MTPQMFGDSLSARLAEKEAFRVAACQNRNGAMQISNVSSGNKVTERHF
jgi:hypothetical protein